MNKPVIILGSGGHAKVLVNVLRLRSVQILGATDADPARKGLAVLNVPVLGDDTEIMKHQADAVHLVNGIGSTRVHPLRRALFEQFSVRGYRFASVIHPSATVADDVLLGEGVQIMAGAIIQPGCHIGKNTVINSGAIVDHDCAIGSYVHIAPGATLSGGVSVGDATHIGTGATVIQGVSIGSECMAAAGAVVVRDVPDGVAVAGVPARNMKVTA